MVVALSTRWILSAHLSWEGPPGPPPASLLFCSRFSVGSSEVRFPSSGSCVESLPRVFLPSVRGSALGIKFSGLWDGWCRSRPLGAAIGRSRSGCLQQTLRHPNGSRDLRLPNHLIPRRELAGLISTLVECCGQVSERIQDLSPESQILNYRRALGTRGSARV